MKYLLLAMILFTGQLFSSQVTKDLDGDSIKDKVTFNKKGMIICKLSTQNFKPIRSAADLYDEQNSVPDETKSGFELRVNLCVQDTPTNFGMSQSIKKYS